MESLTHQPPACQGVGFSPRNLLPEPWQWEGSVCPSLYAWKTSPAFSSCTLHGESIFNDFSPIILQASSFLSRKTQTLSFQMSPWRENKPLALVSSKRDSISSREKKKSISFIKNIRFNPYPFPVQVSFQFVSLLSKSQGTCPFWPHWVPSVGLNPTLPSSVRGLCSPISQPTQAQVGQGSLTQ